MKSLNEFVIDIIKSNNITNINDINFISKQCKLFFTNLFNKKKYPFSEAFWDNPTNLFSENFKDKIRKLCNYMCIDWQCNKSEFGNIDSYINYYYIIFQELNNHKKITELKEIIIMDINFQKQINLSLYERFYNLSEEIKNGLYDICNLYNSYQI